MSYLDQLYQLEGKVAVIIGGTGELCGHLALGLARAGVEVVIAGRNEEKAQQKLDLIGEVGGNAYFVETDLTQKGSLYALLDITPQHHSSILISQTLTPSSTSTSVLHSKPAKYSGNTSSSAALLPPSLTSAPSQALILSHESSPTPHQKPPFTTSQKISPANGQNTRFASTLSFQASFLQNKTELF